jgi:RHH-type rel operon transcriptional repressor/antitoxin RelB
MDDVEMRKPRDVKQRSGRGTRATGRPVNEVAIDDTVEHVDRLDDLHLAERRLAELRTGKAQAISIEEVMKRYS